MRSFPSRAAPLYGIAANIADLATVGSGIPLCTAAGVMGTIGVSGGSVEQDIEVAEAMAAAFLRDITTNQRQRIPEIR